MTNANIDEAPEQRGRRLPALVATLLLLAAALGLAQPAPAGQEGAPGPGAVPAHEYDIIQAGTSVGEASMSLTRTPAGTTSTSSVSVAGVFDAAATLVTNPGGSAAAYHLSGTVQGAGFEIDVTFTEAGADMTLTQGGASQSLSLPSADPLYVFDNNFIEGYQIAADQVMASGKGQTFAALVPQTAAVATLIVEAPVSDTLDYRGAATPVTRLDATFDLGFQALAITLYLDDAGDILVLEQQPGAVSFVRRAGAAAGEAAAGAGGDAAAAGAERGGAQAAIAEAAACLVERDVQIGSTGETLHGKLTLPLAAAEGAGLPAPTLLLLPGSGAVDMDGNAPPFLRNAFYKQLAYELACHGYGVLRVAKLGIPPSTGDGNAVTLGTYASNAADWLAFLAEQPGVAADKLGVIGHSEGGLIALFAAAEGRIDPAVLVLVNAAGRPFDVLLREQLLASLERSGVTGDELEELTGQLDAALEALRNAEGTALALEGELASNPFAATFAHAAGLLRSEMEQDPLALAARVKVPTAVLQGLKDIQVRQVDARNLAGALPRPTLLEFPDLAHNLNFVAGDPLTGAMPSADEPVSSTLVTALATWLNGHLRVAR